MGRPKIHDENTARRLLLVAEKVAETEGLAALSLRRVAAETGLSTRAVYSTFGSKDALAGALGARAFHWLTEELDRAPVTLDPVQDLVEAGAVIFRRLVVEHPVLYHLGFQADCGEVAAEVVRTAASDGLDRLIRRVERVVVRPEDVRDGVRGLNAMCEGLASMELRGNFAADPDPADAWRTALRTFVHGLTAVNRDRTRQGPLVRTGDRDEQCATHDGGLEPDGEPPHGNSNKRSSLVPGDPP